VPLRIAVGPKDMANGTVELYKRESGEKVAVHLEDVDLNIDKYLYKEQNNLLKKNATFREIHTFVVDSYDDFKEKIKT
jgi:prolyl-tRNA synthetase